MAGMYALVFAVGVWASRGQPADTVDELLLAGRSLTPGLALLTMTATWVGGGYINGTAEQTYASGLLWGAQAGMGYALSLLLGGLFFARPMREAGFTTLVDPFERRFGRGLAALLMVPAVLAESFWSAAILVALGSTFGTVMGLDLHLSIVLSAAVAVSYTVLGGLRAVALTDVVQLALIALGLGIALPFAVQAGGGLGALGQATREAVSGLGWPKEALSWSDWFLIFVLGGLPWNVYFQRVLANRDGRSAARMSIAAGFLCLLMALPPLALGLAARGIDWTGVSGTPETAAALAESPTLVLPFLLRYAVPTWIGVFGLGAIAAAVMSSVDSSILSASSLVAWNGYKRLLRPEATPAQVTRLVRVLVVLLGVLATGFALSVGSVAALWYLCGDLVYCVLFPQLLLALFDPRANRLGALAGLVVSGMLRLGGGDANLGLPAFLPYPSWGDGLEFPFRTLAMVGGLLAALAVSRATGRLDAPRPLNPRLSESPAS